MSISAEELNDIRAKANIVNIIGGYIPLTQRGKNFLCVCPFHDDHSPSMSVSEEKQIYKCFSCGATGNVFTFVCDYENVSFQEAVKIVADKVGVVLSNPTFDSGVKNIHKDDYDLMELVEKFYQNNLKTKEGKEALDYLHDRGISDKIISDFGIGLSLDSQNTLLNLLTKKKYDLSKLKELGLINDNGKDMFTRRITFPLWDKDGHIVGFSARIYRGEKDTSKYMNSKETPIFKKGETLYNYHNARDDIKREKSVIVVEGFMDAIRLSESGIKNVVALCGTAMTSNQIELLKKLRVKVILCLDNDNAGLLATLNNGEELVKNNLETYVIRLSGYKDPDEYILNNGVDAFKENVTSPQSFFEFKMNNLKSGKDFNKTEDLTSYIHEVIGNLKKSSDEILIEVTLKKLSEETGVDLSILKNEFGDIKRVELVEPRKEVKQIEVKKRNAYIILIEKILYFMLNGGIFINEYQQKLGYFEEEEYSNLANEIIYYYDKNRSISPADFLTYVNDNENLRKLVSFIVGDSMNDEVTIELMDEYIDSLNKIVTKREINKLRESMKTEMDMDKKIKIANQIAELKRGSV